MVTAVAIASPSHASAICDRIRSALNSVHETIGNSAETRVYARAIQRQQQEIMTVRGQMQEYGCSGGSVLVFGGRHAQACNMLADTLDNMQSNLEALRDHNSSLTTMSMSRRDRQKLLRALDDNGCNDAVNDPEDTSAQPASFSNETVMTPDPPRPFEQDQSYNPRPGDLQTVCVRTSDGGFFPLSSNVSSDNFGHDAQVCSAMCQGSETRLFYHHIGTDEMSDMVSADDDAPYKEQPYAFRFRTESREQSKANGCNFTAYYRTMLHNQITSQPTQPAPQRYSSITNLQLPETNSDIPAPPQKPAQSNNEIPRTSEATPPKPPVDRPYDPGKQVRQVGPSFVPSQDTATDIRRPLKNEAN